MIVCLCRNLSQDAIHAQLDAGASSADDVARATGAGTDCGCCRGEVEEIVRSRRSCSWPPCPGCPRSPGRGAA